MQLLSQLSGSLEQARQLRTSNWCVKYRTEIEDKETKRDV